MTRLGRMMRNALERFAKSFYEGPHPPLRLQEMVIDFANSNPRATRKEWVAFAAGQAEEAYKAGYIRGLEYSERDETYRAQVKEVPDQVADQLDPDWRWSPGIKLEGPPQDIPEEEDIEPFEVTLERIERSVLDR